MWFIQVIERHPSLVVDIESQLKIEVWEVLPNISIDVKILCNESLIRNKFRHRCSNEFKGLVGMKATGTKRNKSGEELFEDIETKDNPTAGVTAQVNHKVSFARRNRSGEELTGNLLKHA